MAGEPDEREQREARVRVPRSRSADLADCCGQSLMLEVVHDLEAHDGDVRPAGRRRRAVGQRPDDEREADSAIRRARPASYRQASTVSWRRRPRRMTSNRATNNSRHGTAQELPERLAVARRGRMIRRADAGSGPRRCFQYRARRTTIAKESASGRRSWASCDESTARAPTTRAVAPGEIRAAPRHAIDPTRGSALNTWARSAMFTSWRATNGTTAHRRATPTRPAHRP